jgi:hypothetical protein
MMMMIRVVGQLLSIDCSVAAADDDEASVCA